MPGPILFCDSWNLKEAETRPDLGFFYNTYIPIFSTILEVEILPILVLRGAFNRRKNSSLDFLGGRKGGLGWFLIILLVELRAKENTTFSSVWWEDKDFTGWHRLHYGPHNGQQELAEFPHNYRHCQEKYLHMDHFTFNCLCLAEVLWKKLQPPKAPTTVTMFIWDNNLAHKMYISKGQNIYKTSLFYQNLLGRHIKHILLHCRSRTPQKLFCTKNKGL